MVTFYGIDWTMSRKGSGFVVHGVLVLDRWSSNLRGSRDGPIQERYRDPIWQLWVLGTQFTQLWDDA